MTRKKKALVALLCVLGFLVVLVVALAVIVNELDWNRFKPQIEQRVSQAIGRPFQIAGPLQVQWSREVQDTGWRAWVPRPYVSADGLKLGNASWAQAPDMVGLDHLRVGISLLPLLHHAVDLHGLQMTGLSVDLERQGDGRANWQFDLPASQSKPSQPSTPWTVNIDRIMFDKSHIHVDDAMSRTDVVLTLGPLARAVPFSAVAGKLLDAPATSASSASNNAAGSQSNSDDATALTQAEQASAQTKTTPQDYVFAWTAKGRFRGLALDGHGRLGGMLTLQDASQPFPVDIDLAIGNTRAEMIGTLTDPMHLGALNLQLRLSGASMADLYPLTGVTLPDTPAYGTDGRLIANLHHANGAVFLYRDFNGHVGQSDLHGSLQFAASKPRAKLSGKVWSDQLRMKDLGPLIGVNPNAKPATEAASTSADPQKAPAKTPAAAGSDKVLPTQTFRTDRWRQMDADVIFSGSHIVYDAKLPLSDLNTHVVMDDGHLTIDPLSFGMAGGKIQGSLKVNGAENPMSGVIKLQARSLQLKQLFPQMASSNVQDVLGQMGANVDLSGRGNSVATLLAHSNGEAQMLVSQGVVSRGLLELAGLNVGNYLMSKLFGDEDVKINCAAADVGITDGLLKTRIAAMDTVNAIINVSGTANFQTEGLDLTVTPQSKGYRILSLRSPLYIQGTFAHPDVGVKAAPLLARAAGVAALSVLLTPAAGLLALIAPSGSDKPQSECMGLLHQDSKLPPSQHMVTPAKAH